MTDTRFNIMRAEGVARENAMRWAMQTAKIGESTEAILARAQIYAEYILGPVARISCDIR